MAYESVLPPEVAARLKALVSGGASSKSVDGKRGNPDGQRATPPAPKGAGAAEQGSNPNRRVDGSSGTRKEEAKGTPFNRGVPEPTASSSPNPFTASSNILETIATRFNIAREQARSGAWKQLQTDLMNASPFICPALIPYKDLIQIVADIEKEIKGASSQIGKSNEELLANFLNGGDFIPVTIPESPPEPIDIGTRMGKGGGESPASS